MTSLNLQTAAPDPLAERVAELEQQRQALAGDHAERRRLQAADKQAQAAYQEARSAHSRILTDADANIEATAEDHAKAASSHKAARDLAFNSGTELSVHVELHGDLDARARKISAENELLAQARAQAEHQAITKQKIPLLLQLEALELQEHELLKRAYNTWPKDDGEIARGAALPALTFPEAVFIPAAVFDNGVPKSIFRDDYLKMVAVSYPDLLGLLPEDQAAAVTEKLTEDYRRNTTLFAGRAVWHFVELHGQRGPQIARGANRLGYRGL
jgi:hypothetical protein